MHSPPLRGRRPRDAGDVPPALTSLAAAIAAGRHDLVSTDLFDTVLLRDRTLERERFALASHRAAARLGLDAGALTRLRWSVHRAAYTAVAMERPEGEASLIAMCRATATALGLGDSAAQVLRDAEVGVDVEHLRPSRPLLGLLERAAATGTRVVAVSDTWYSGDDLHRILTSVVGEHPLAAVYSSADLGRTKHAGGIFAVVAATEGVAPGRILHVGDSARADVQRAQEAGWTAVHVPRERGHRAAKVVGAALALRELAAPVGASAGGRRGPGRARQAVTAESFGREVLGPVVAEFCLLLWSLTALLERPDDAALLFSARGGLRMQLAHERFLAAGRLPSPVPARSFMVSRVAAIRPALRRTLAEDLDTVLPAAATALSYEFAQSTLAEVARAVTGVPPGGGDRRWEAPFTPAGLAALLRHPDGAGAAEALVRQSDLFVCHTRELLGGRTHAVLVDTGLYGTTQDVLAEGLPGTRVSCALLARTYRPAPPTGRPPAFGLSVQAHDYSPLSPRTALLRYWHFVEWLFEPRLPSVKTFVDEDGESIRSNLEVSGWAERVLAEPGSAFSGVISYLDSLSAGPAQQVVADAARAWRALQRAVVWPDADHSRALAVDVRSHDFGREGTWSEPVSRGPVATLRSDGMWREGELARSGTLLRVPLQAALEAAYATRSLRRGVARRVQRAG